MKKSMFALFGCALVAGSVMAAEVTGNNVAVVIQKDPVVSSNLYQFLMVPVNGFDITGQASVESLTLDQILPPSLYNGFTVYAADGDGPRYTSDGTAWTSSAKSTPESEPAYPAGTALWLLAPTGTGSFAKTVFCGELASDEFVVTPQSGLTVFGNATSTEKDLSGLEVNGGAQPGDTIFVLKSGSNEYSMYCWGYDPAEKAYCWMKENINGGAMVPATDVSIPAGEAAYYLR